MASTLGGLECLEHSLERSMDIEPFEPHGPHGPHGLQVEGGRGPIGDATP